MLFLKPTNPFRQWVVRLIVSPIFEFSILAVIFLNCLILVAVDHTEVYDDGTPDPRNSAINRLYYQANLPFVVIFAVEFLFKIIAMGFTGSNGSYLSDKWNLLDLLVVFIG